MRIPVDLECLAEFLSQILGGNAEVVVHDLTNMEHSLQIIKNAHISQRKIGDAATDLTLRMMRERMQDKVSPFLCNYTGKTIDGRLLRSSSMVIRDDGGQPIAMLCVNIDDAPLRAAIEEISALIPNNSKSKTLVPEEELFSSSIEQVGEKLFWEIIGKYPSPPSKLSTNDKKIIIKSLDESGIFQVKGFVAKAAGILNLSEPTLYRYLKSNVKEDTRV